MWGRRRRKKKDKKQNILQESLLCSEPQLLNTVALNHVHWGNSCSCLRCYCSSAVCYLPFAGRGLNTNLPQQFRLNVTLSNIRQIRSRHILLSPSITGECSSPCKRAGVGMGNVSSPSKFLYCVWKGCVYVCCVPESPDCTLLLLIMKCVSTYSAVTGLVKSVLEN